MFFRKREREPTPNWLKWLFIGFFLYAMVTYYREDSADRPNPLRQAVNEASKEVKGGDFFNYSDYKERIFPSYVGSLRINDTKLGSGLPAVCGQEAAITFAAWLDKDNKIEEATAEKPLRFIIGEGTAMPVFEQGVIGMQPGGSRSLIAPMQLSYGTEGHKRDELAPGTMVRFDVTLLEVTPPLPDPDAVPYRIAVTRPSSGKSHICGETVKAQLTLWDTKGSKLFTTYGEGKAPLNFTLGLSQVFSGLEQGVVGMREGEMRTLIVPPSFQKPLRPNPKAVDFHLPQNQTIIVDVELIP